VTTSECPLSGDEAKFELQGPNGRVIAVAGDLIGSGRVASVFAVVDPPIARSLVLKLFNERPIDPNVEEIIRLIDERGLDEVAPVGADDEHAFPLVATPKCLVFAEAGEEPIGIAVLRVDSDRFRPLNVVLNGTRVKRDLSYGTSIAVHLADLVNEIHSRGFVIGDISGTNLLADDSGFVTVVDVDSFGVEFDDGRSPISAGFATSNYIAPDILDGHATIASDRFVIACLILQFLLHGMHPFGGVRRGVLQSSIQENMSNNDSWLFARDEFVLPKPFHAYMSMESLPPTLRRLARAALRSPERPSAEEWLEATVAAADRIGFCEHCGQQKFEEAACSACSSGRDIPPFQVNPEDAPPTPPAATVPVATPTPSPSTTPPDVGSGGLWGLRKKRRA